jgi:hypothetical protein
MIPPFNHSHVLPPFLGDELTMQQASPYVTTSVELVQHFGNSIQRRALLRSFFALRTRLRSMGFVHGFFWIDGSFVENVEHSRQLSPGDIDTVFFANPPSHLVSAQEWVNLASGNSDVFERKQCKNKYACDFILINLGKPPEKLVKETRYWYGLFSHRRVDQVWKGLLELPMNNDDASALALLDNLELGDPHVAPA